MKYYIKRDVNEYGPYTLADLQRYVAQGNIVMTDLARSEGMTDWAPVSQILGTIPVAVPPAPTPASAGTAGSGPAASAGTVYSGPSAVSAAYGASPGYGITPAATTGPVPQDFHWALVLVIGFFCSIFYYVWLFIEASFVKRIRPESNFLGFLIAGVAGAFAFPIVAYGVLIAAVATQRDEAPVIAFVVCGLAYLAAIVLLYVGIFKMRAAIQDYYNTVEPINLRLSGVMTFFFAVFYFQYHFSRIAQWKKTGYLQPQG